MRITNRKKISATHIVCVDISYIDARLVAESVMGTEPHDDVPTLLATLPSESLEHVEVYDLDYFVDLCNDELIDVEDIFMGYVTIIDY